MNTDINAVISRLRSGDGNCILPETCTSQYCADWKVLVAYIRELEEFSDNAWTTLLWLRNFAKEAIENLTAKVDVV